MNGAYRIADRRFAYAAVFLDGFNRGFEVSYVIKSVENSDYGYAVVYARFNELIYDVVGIMFVTEQILTAEKHLNGSFLEMAF